MPSPGAWIGAFACGTWRVSRFAIPASDLTKPAPVRPGRVFLFVKPSDAMLVKGSAQAEHLAEAQRRGGGTSLENLVPGEGIEPPTNGLQNRCSTAELARHAGLSYYPILSILPLPVESGRAGQENTNSGAFPGAWAPSGAPDR